MSWKKTGAYWALCFVLAGYYAAFEHQAPPPRIQQTKEEQVLQIFEEEVVALTLRGDGREVRGERGERKRWEVTAPADAKVPGDLFTALVDGLTSGQRAEVVSRSPSEEEVAGFGLASPAWELEAETRGGKKIKVEFGTRNPPSTAVYARTGEDPRVFLVGLNVQYYGELILTAVGAETASAGSEAAEAPAAEPSS